jgi:hypothetical protein
MSRYAVKMVLTDGQVLRATVTKATLRGLKLSACRSVSWVKVRA